LGEKLAGLTVLDFIFILIAATVKSGQLQNSIYEYYPLD
jgi:hypothetical protein